MTFAGASTPVGAEDYGRKSVVAATWQRPNTPGNCRQVVTADRGPVASLVAGALCAHGACSRVRASPVAGLSVIVGPADYGPVVRERCLGRVEKR